MESKEQPNQNPEQIDNSNVQDEKPVADVVKAENEEITKEVTTVSEKQISDDDKDNIVDLIHDKPSDVDTIDKTKEASKLSEDVVTGKEELPGSKNQISDNDKLDIVVLIKDKPVIAETNDTAVESSESSEASDNADVTDETLSKTQISDAEKISIICLLHGKDEAASHVEMYDDIDFEHLNKQELVEILEEVVQQKDISLIKSQVGKINSAFYQHNKEEIENDRNDFIASGGKEEEFNHVADPLEVRFNAAIGIYKHNKSRFSQDLEKQKVANLKLKHELLEELKDLINSEETLKKTYDEFKKLQESWKEIGMIPASELRNLWQSYHFLVEKFFDKVRINRELRDLDLKKNLEAKIALCEKAEELIVEKSILKSFKSLQYYHDKWREIGPVPANVKEDIWERFKGITDRINLRRKEYYKELQDQQQTNYDAKLVLCEKAKEIVAKPVDTLKGWQATTDKMNELLKLWKTIGRAPKAKNDEVWATFKGSLDSFFGAKREYLNELKEQQVNNYNLKLDLCTKAESIKESSDWGNTTRELIKLQKDWKGIGPVPRKYSDKIWKRFRASCDDFFNRKSDHFKNIHSVEDENLQKKKDLISSITGYKVEKDKNANLSALKDFQKLWIEIGFVPFKEKEKIQSTYREAIDQLISKMDVNKSDLSAADFKNKLDILKSGPDAGARLSKERTFISSKIRKINEDLSVWENNIGFFSNSKQSNKLKEEFEQKINSAKSEIDSLKARLKLLNS